MHEHENYRIPRSNARDFVVHERSASHQDYMHKYPQNKFQTVQKKALLQAHVSQAGQG